MTTTLSYSHQLLGEYSSKNSSSFSVEYLYQFMSASTPKIPFIYRKISLTKSEDYFVEGVKHVVTKQDLLDLFPNLKYLSKEREVGFHKAIKNMSLGQKRNLFDFYDK